MKRRRNSAPATTRSPPVSRKEIASEGSERRSRAARAPLPVMLSLIRNVGALHVASSLLCETVFSLLRSEGRPRGSPGSTPAPRTRQPRRPPPGARPPRSASRPPRAEGPLIANRKSQPRRDQIDSIARAKCAASVKLVLFATSFFIVFRNLLHTSLRRFGLWMQNRKTQPRHGARLRTTKIDQTGERQCACPE